MLSELLLLASYVKKIIINLQYLNKNPICLQRSFIKTLDLFFRKIIKNNKT